MIETTSRPLRIFAPGSLMGVSGDLADGFMAAFPGAARPGFTFAMTGELAEHLTGGAPADVGLFADRGYAVAVHDAKRLSEPRSLAGNRLTIVVSKASDAAIESLSDLVKPGIRLALLPPGRDPGGAYAAALFKREGMADAVAAKLASGEAVMLGRGRPMGAMFAGEIDALVIYATVAPSLAELTREVALPPEQDMHEAIEFTIGLVEGGDRHPLAAPFVEWMLGPGGQDALRRAGFTPPRVSV